MILLLLFAAAFCVETSFSVTGEGNFILKGRIADIADRPVEEAEVYVFDSKNVKRPADYVSNRTGKDGLFRVELPHGSYWLVAIARKSDRKFGPLTKDDRHSGEAVELSTQGKKEHYIDFTVLDLREAARRNQKQSESLIRISGRVLDKKGKVVHMAYVMANKKKGYGKLPHYLSAWTDRDGQYTIYVPRGPLFIGAEKKFPPETGRILNREVNFESNAADIDVEIVDR